MPYRIPGNNRFVSKAVYDQYYRNLQEQKEQEKRLIEKKRQDEEREKAFFVGISRRGKTEKSSRT